MVLSPLFAPAVGESQDLGCPTGRYVGGHSRHDLQRGRLQRDLGAQAAEELDRLVLIGGAQQSPEVLVEGKTEPGRHDPDHGHGRPVHLDRRAWRFRGRGPGHGQTRPAFRVDQDRAPFARLREPTDDGPHAQRLQSALRDPRSGGASGCAS